MSLFPTLNSNYCYVPSWLRGTDDTGGIEESSHEFTTPDEPDEPIDWYINENGECVDPNGNYLGEQCDFVNRDTDELEVEQGLSDEYVPRISWYPAEREHLKESFSNEPFEPFLCGDTVSQQKLRPDEELYSSPWLFSSEVSTSESPPPPYDTTYASVYDTSGTLESNEFLKMFDTIHNNPSVILEVNSDGEVYDTILHYIARQCITRDAMLLYIKAIELQPDAITVIDDDRRYPLDLLFMNSDKDIGDIKCYTFVNGGTRCTYRQYLITYTLRLIQRLIDSNDPLVMDIRSTFDKSLRQFIMKQFERNDVGINSYDIVNIGLVDDIFDTLLSNV